MACFPTSRSCHRHALPVLASGCVGKSYIYNFCFGTRCCEEWVNRPTPSVSKLVCLLGSRLVKPLLELTLTSSHYRYAGRAPSRSPTPRDHTCTWVYVCDRCEQRRSGWGCGRAAAISWQCAWQWAYCQWDRARCDSQKTEVAVSCSTAKVEGIEFSLVQVVSRNPRRQVVTHPPHSSEPTGISGRKSRRDHPAPPRERRT